MIKSDLNIVLTCVHNMGGLRLIEWLAGWQHLIKAILYGVNVIEKSHTWKPKLSPN